MNKNLIFRDENGNFFFTSRVSRRERDFFYSNLVFREGDENLKIISQGRVRKNKPNSHENSRDREFSLCSATQPPVWLPGLPPVVEAKHDGEGAGGQYLLLALVVQTVSRCQCKSVSNLSRKKTELGNKQISFMNYEEKQVGDILTNTAEHLLFR